MVEASTTSRLLQGWLDRLRLGEASARQELLAGSYERLRQITSKMLKRYPRVHRWEQTDDVLQNVCLRLDRALQACTPASVREFLRLASVNIRRELLDLVKHYYGPLGEGTRHASNIIKGQSPSSAEVPQPPDLVHEPTRLLAWSEFHQQAEALPEDEREVFDLLWYQGLSQADAAEVLGVTERTIKRRWQAARLRLYDALHGELPPPD
jgi:RNA polymerase sigma factor (sigma-70 family)